MPAKRIKAKLRRGHITAEDAAAFVAGDGLALRRALGLKPWEYTDSPTAERCRTVDQIMAKRGQIEVELMDWKR